MHTDQGAAFRRRFRSLGLADNNNETTRDATTTEQCVEPSTETLTAPAVKPKANYMSACYLYIFCLGWNSIKSQFIYLFTVVAVIALAGKSTL